MIRLEVVKSKEQIQRIEFIITQIGVGVSGEGGGA